MKGPSISALAFMAVYLLWIVRTAAGLILSWKQIGKEIPEKRNGSGPALDDSKEGSKKAEYGGDALAELLEGIKLDLLLLTSMVGILGFNWFIHMVTDG